MRRWLLWLHDERAIGWFIFACCAFLSVFAAVRCVQRHDYEWGFLSVLMGLQGCGALKNTRTPR